MEYKKWFRKMHKGVETESTEMSYSTTHTKMVSSAPQKGFMWPDLVCRANRFSLCIPWKINKKMTCYIQPQFLDLVPKFLPSFSNFFLPFSIHYFFSWCYLLSLPHSLSLLFSTSCIPPPSPPLFCLSFLSTIMSRYLFTSEDSSQYY